MIFTIIIIVLLLLLILININIIINDTINFIIFRIFILFPYFLTGAILASLTEMFHNRKKSLNTEENYFDKHITSSITWKFLPDALAISAGLLLSCTGTLCSNLNDSYNILYLFAPSILMLFIFCNVHNNLNNTKNLSRIFLESNLLQTLGYCSYPLYLFQNIFLQYYATYFKDFEGYSYHKDSPDRMYFREIPLLYRFLYILFLIFLCYLFQKYFQGKLVPFIYEKFSSCLNQSN